MKSSLIFLGLLSFASCTHSPVGKTRSESCSNVRIQKDFAYASCKENVFVKNLKSGSEIQTSIQADDIAVADNFLFTIEMNDTLSMYSLNLPTQPILIQVQEDVPAKFFTGLDAAGGYVVVSGGLKDPSFFKYSASGLQRLQWETKAREYFGRPDVSLFKLGPAFKAVFSLDVSLTYKWGTHILTFTTDKITNDQFIPLESGFSPFQLLSYSPTNFPISSAMIGSDLYVSHWKTQEIILILPDSQTTQQILKTDFTISHMTSDSKCLYFVSKQKPGEFYKFDPQTKKLNTIKDARIQKPTNIAVSGTHWAIADTEVGLITGDF